MQRLVYYVSKSLQEAEVHYLPLEKAILAIVHATRKLSYYFQAHTIVVLTQLPLQSLLWRSNYIGRVVKWGTILGAFDIKYLTCTVIKGQVLVDLVAEFIECLKKAIVEENEEIGAWVTIVTVPYRPVWKLYANGVAN